MSQDAQKLAHQLELEKLYSNHQLMPRLRAEFTEDPVFTDYLAERGINVDLGIDFLIQIALHKRCPLTTMVGLLWKHLKDSQATVDAIQQMLDMELAYLDPITKNVLIVRFEIGAALQADLDKFQYPLPMVVEPNEVMKNSQSGYLTSHGSILLRNNHHNDDVCLDHINRANRIPLKINHVASVMIKNSWKNLDKQQPDETPEDFKKRVRAFQKYDKHSKEVIDFLISEGNEFYLTHKYDKRGRTYSQGYFVNYQGNSWNKACVLFAEEEMIE
ncbi:RNA polymerase, single-subunit [Stenotrophomonas phage Philippe]|uniref:RNA polymerase, single-subunit n=1 Tax=Stenotrophomonas phage Philippe TaxID=2859655 RepID=A0AAE7WMJ5_9CAUD|nr:RNA polymerase, single-subunit [Stenotrophomonas phage Philippe]QYW02223.1 RNA polymerase, single-subunit [Stenotrophomonas phage Philippe]